MLVNLIWPNKMVFKSLPAQAIPRSYSTWRCPRTGWDEEAMTLNYSGGQLAHSPIWQQTSLCSIHRWKSQSQLQQRPPAANSLLAWSQFANRTSKKPFPAPGHPQPCLSLSQTLHLQRAAAITKQVWVTQGQHCYSLTRFLCFQDLGVLCLHHLLHLHPMFDGCVVPDSGWYKQADLGLLK